MEQIRWWTWLLFVSALMAIILLIGGPLGHKYELLPLGKALGSVMVAMVIAGFVLLAGSVMLFTTAKQGFVANRKYIAIAVGLSLFHSIVMAVQIQKAGSAPGIHDISTDTNQPPVFYKIVALRREAPNPLTYGSEDMPRDQLVKLQSENYPDVKSLQTDLNVSAAFDRAEALLKDQDIEIVHRDNVKGIIEATATTYWFGFKDDLVVRVKPSNSGSLIDIRSVSRVGKSDLGTNARRIEKLLSAFQE